MQSTYSTETKITKSSTVLYKIRSDSFVQYCSSIKYFLWNSSIKYC